MTNKRRPTPRHIETKRGNHPRPELTIVRLFEIIPEPRGASCNFKHPLTTLLFIAVVCSLCGANDWETIVLQAQAMEEWMGQFVDLSAGVPSVRTFERVFAILDPEELQRTLISVANLMRNSKEGDFINFDGKTLRGTVDTGKELRGIHLLNAWSRNNGICIGQIKVDEKSNEITAMPELMELLDLKGTVITADAMNTQKEVARKALDKGADYVLPVKGNHPALLEEIELLLKEAEETNFVGIDAASHESLDKAHGRIETRKYYSIDGESIPSAKEWPGLRSLGKVIRERIEKGKVSHETRYYISSCDIDAIVLEEATRGHWGIENSLHWILDVVFREDRLRYRQRIGTLNLAVLRKIVLDVLVQDKTVKCGKEGKRLLAATDPGYREKLLKFLF